MKNKLVLAVLLLAGVSFAKAQSPGFTKLGNVPTGVTYTDSTCPNQSTCYYQVTALDAQNFESVPSACGTSQLCVGGNIAVVSMPSSGTHSVTLTWTASTSTGVTYNVYRHIGPLAASNLSAVVN